MNTGGAVNELTIQTYELTIQTYELHIIFNVWKCPANELRVLMLWKTTRQMNSVNKWYKIYPTNELTFYKNKTNTRQMNLLLLKLK